MIEIIHSFTPDSFTQTFTDLRPGDALLFTYAYSDCEESWYPNGPASDLTLLAQPGDIATEFTVVPSPDDAYWMPYIGYGTSVAGDDCNETYLCIWLIDGFSAGSYRIDFAEPTSAGGTIRWGKLIRGVDPDVWGFDSQRIDPNGGCEYCPYTPLIGYNHDGVESFTFTPYPRTVDISSYDGAIAILTNVVSGGGGVDGDGVFSDQDYGVKIDEMSTVLTNTFLYTDETGDTVPASYWVDGPDDPSGDGICCSGYPGVGPWHCAPCPVTTVTTGVRLQSYLIEMAPSVTELTVATPNHTLLCPPGAYYSSIAFSTDFLILAGDPAYTGEEGGDPPTCDGVSADIDDDTLLVTGTGTGILADTWEVRSDPGGDLMDSGSGNEASFSFDGDYGDYILKFINADGDDSCSFGFEEPPPSSPPKPPLKPGDPGVPGGPIVVPPVKPMPPGVVGGQPPVGAPPGIPVSAPPVQGPGLPGGGGMPPGWTGGGDGDGWPPGGGGGGGGGGASPATSNVKQGVAYASAVQDPQTRDFVRQSVESAMKGVATRTRDLQAQIKNLHRELPNIVATRDHANLPPAVPAALAFALDEKAWYACDESSTWAKLSYDANLIEGASFADNFYSAIKAALVEGDNIELTYDDVAGEITIASTGGSGSGLPAATAVGQVLISLDGATFVPALPLIGESGEWLSGDNGVLLVQG